jgi:hypothetical protein
MVDLFQTLVGVVLLASSLHLGHKAIIAGRLYRSVSTSEGGSASTLVDGEKVAIEGTVNVRDPAPLSNLLSFDDKGSVGAYVWGLKDSESHTKNNRITHAAGIESGTFTVDDGRREIRIDTDWLAETHDSADITTVSLGWTVTTGLSGRSWKSQYIQLEDNSIVNPTPMMEYISDADAPEEIPDDETFEARVILDGEMLAVSGEVSMEQGTPVLQGSDNEPLVLSEQGFDEFNRGLPSQMLKYGLIAVGIGAFASLVLANGLGIV